MRCSRDLGFVLSLTGPSRSDGVGRVPLTLAAARVDGGAARFAGRSLGWTGDANPGERGEPDGRGLPMSKRAFQFDPIAHASTHS
jgi:hypothetical protein